MDRDLNVNSGIKNAYLKCLFPIAADSSDPEMQHHTWNLPAGVVGREETVWCPVEKMEKKNNANMLLHMTIFHNELNSYL